MEKRLMNIKELGEVLGLKRKTMYQYLADNTYGLKDHMFKIGNSWRVDKAGYEALLKEMKEVVR